MNNRVAVLGDFNLAGYDTGNSALLSLVNYIRCFQYPNRGFNPRNAVNGYEGDPVYIQVPFRVETAAVGGVQPILGKVSFSIVATKSGEADFVVETWQTDQSAACRSGNQQNINVSQSKGYITYPGDPYNNVSLTTAKWANSGTKLGFLLSYAFVLRYDYWNTILTTAPGGQSCNAPINNDIANVNNAWSNLQTNGWGLVARFYAEVTGYDGTITPFQAQTTITCNAGNTLPAAGPNFAIQTNYFDTSGNAVTSVIKGGQTRIQTIFTSNGVAIPTPYNDYTGYIWADKLNGGPTTRRSANTEYVSEVGSPFSNPGNLIYAGSPTKTRFNGLVAIGEYSGGLVVLETIYDDSVTGWGAKSTQMIVMAKVGFKINNELQNNSNIDILINDQQQIIA